LKIIQYYRRTIRARILTNFLNNQIIVVLNFRGVILCSSHEWKSSYSRTVCVLQFCSSLSQKSSWFCNYEYEHEYS